MDFLDFAVNQVWVSLVQRGLRDRRAHLDPKENLETPGPLSVAPQEKLESQDILEFKENQENQESQSSSSDIQDLKVQRDRWDFQESQGRTESWVRKERCARSVT